MRCIPDEPPAEAPLLNSHEGLAPDPTAIFARSRAACDALASRAMN